MAQQLYEIINGVQQPIDPTTADSIQAEWAANASAQAETAYIGQRISAYPTIGDQLGALWALVNQLVAASTVTLPTETAQIAATIAAVKAQYPAPAGSPTIPDSTAGV